MNIYKKTLCSNLPRLLNLYNRDRFSPTYGYGDRLYWGWRISDFSNGTMQGGVHALAVAVKLGLIENLEFAIEIIDSAIRAIEKIRAKNGSLVEACPNEGSFCVTAQVAFDTLSTIRALGNDIDHESKREYLAIIRPLIRFITRNDEKHAVISNHLASGVAAIEFWNILTGENSERGRELLDQIYRHQSKEGWYLEYDGPDPGYQTLCTYYLSRVYEITGDDELFESLKRSGRFLQYFVHPDGTIGGLYGSRNTEVYYPGGLVALASASEEFRFTANSLHRGILAGNHILPQDIDIGNFVPLLNSYADAALHCEQSGINGDDAQCQTLSRDAFVKEFDRAGIYICSTEKYYAIINYKKGGTLKVYDQETGVLDLEDGGIFGRLGDKKTFTTQQFDENNNFQNNEIHSGLWSVNPSYLNPWTSVLLRILGLSLFKSNYFRELFKKCVVGILTKNKSQKSETAIRKFEFSDDKIIVRETIEEPSGCKSIGHLGKCKSIHMASSGYYLRQDQKKPQRSSLVMFKFAVRNEEKGVL